MSEEFKTYQDALKAVEKLKEEIEIFIKSMTMSQKTNTSASSYSERMADADAIKKEINERNADKMELFSIGPLYPRPAYYLDSFTPFVKVVMILDIANPYNEKYRFEIFDNSKDQMNNHIKNFSVDYLGQGGLKFTLGLSDVDNQLTDLLSFQLMALNAKGILPWFEIEYGWANNKAAISSTKQNVRFTKKIFCVLGGEEGDQGFSVTTNLSGVTDLTITGKYDSTPPPPSDQSPIQLLGPCPAINLTSYYIYNSLEKILKGEVVGRKGDHVKNISALVVEVYLLIYKTHNMKPNPTDFERLLVTMILYFRAKGTINNDFFPYKKDNLNVVAPGTDDSIQSREQTDWCVLQIKSKFKILMRQASQTKGYCKSSKTIISNASTIKEFKNNVVDESLKTKRSYDIGKNEFNSMSIIVANLFFDFFRAYIAYASEMKIHPYYVWNYCWEMFDLNIQDKNKGKVLLLDDGLLGDNAVSALGNNKSESSYWNTTLFDKDDYRKNNIGSVLPSCEARFDITKKEHREKYMEPAMSFNISNSQDWGTYFNYIGSKIKINYYITDKFEAGLMDVDITKGDYKKTKYGKLIIKPMGIHVSLEYLPRKQTVETIDIFKKLLTARKKKLMLFKNKVNKTLAEKMIHNIELQETAINNFEKEHLGNAVITGAKEFFYIGYRNVIPMDSAMSLDVNATKILQCYSTRPYNFDNFYNSGEASCWDVNFPDVLSFDIENFKPYSNANALNMTTYFSAEKVDFKETGLTDYKKRLDDLRTEFDKIKKAKKDVIEKDMPGITTKLQTLYNDVANFETNQERLKHPVKFKIGHYGDTIVQDQSYNGIIGRTKQIQEMRYMISTIATTYNVNMEVVGDASFGINDIGKYLFVKYIHNDGGIGYFTGIYNIMGITDKIQAGSFTTQFKLQFQPILGDEYPDISAEFTRRIYGEGGGTFETTNGMVKNKK